MTKRKNNAGYYGTRFNWIVGLVCILALQDAECATFSCPASAYTPFFISVSGTIRSLAWT